MGKKVNAARRFSSFPRLRWGMPAPLFVIPPLTLGHARAASRHSPAYSGACPRRFSSFPRAPSSFPRKRESYVADGILVRMSTCPTKAVRLGCQCCASAPPPSFPRLRGGRPAQAGIQKRGAQSPSFPRKRESYVAYAIRVRMPTCPTKAVRLGCQCCASAPPPSFPRLRGGRPAQAGIQKRGAQSPSFPRKRESYVAYAIRVRMPTCLTKAVRSDCRCCASAFAPSVVIPPLTRGHARAVSRHSPAYAGACPRRFSSFPRAPSSFPRKRESYVADGILVRMSTCPN